MNKFLKTNSVALLVSSVSLALSVFTYNLMTNSEIKRAHQEYDFAIQERRTSLSFEFKYRQSALNSLKEYIETSQSFNFDQLANVAQSAISNYKISAVCFIDSENQLSLAAGEDQKECETFDFTQTSKIIARDKIKILISAPIIASPPLRGYLTFIFTLDSLRKQIALSSMNEYLVAQNPTTLSLSLYDLNGNLLPRSNLNFSQSKKVNYYDLLHLDEFSLFYVTSIHSQTFAVESTGIIFVISLLIFLLGSLSGYFIQILGRQKKIIGEEVKTRTEELNQFAYRTSHDLKSPLTTIKGLAKFSILDLQNRNLEEVQNNIERILLQAEKLERLVSDILSIAKSDLSEIETEEVNGIEYLNQLIAHYSHQKELFGIQFEVRCNVQRNLMLPKPRLDQILDNLITNAIKYRKANVAPYILIQMKSVGNILEISVEDNGVGFPVERMKEVFKPFKRFHPRMAEGNGLGLSIVKRNIDKLGGEIHLTSNGDGSKFLVKIPLIQKENL